LTIKTTSDSCRIDWKKFKRLDIPMASLIWLSHQIKPSETQWIRYERNLAS